MNALTFEGKETVRFRPVADPKIESPTDALLRIELAGICGSDLHPFHEREKGLDRGTVMGHEAVGIVEAVGSGVKTLKPGDRVCGPFTTNCGSCWFCRRGLSCRCPQGQLFGWVEKGKGLHGLQAELARVPLADGTLKVVPDGVSAEAALLAGDIFSTGFFAAEQAEVGDPERTTVIVGCGPVGLMAAAACRALGAGRVFAVDGVEERLELAASFGARALSLKEDVAALVRRETDGRGADAVIEAVGSPAAGKLAFDLLRPGGTLSVAGVHTSAEFPFSPAEAYNKNLIYKVGRCPARSYMDKVLPLLVGDKLGVTRIISHRLPLAEGAHGYHVFDKKLDRCIKVVLSANCG